MTSKKSVQISLILMVLITLSTAIFALANTEDTTVPLFGLDIIVHRTLFWYLFPILGSIITVLLFSRVFAPLFLKAKRKIYFRYEDCYIDNKSAALTKRMFIIRMIYTLFLTLGLMAFILPMIDVSQIIAVRDMEGYTSDGIIPRYSLPSLMGVIGFILPIVVGLWSIGWAMEDAGLMHYRLDDTRPGKLFEIEPIHIKYNSYLKGYAGITAIFFIVGVSLYFAGIGGTRMEDAIMAFIVPLTSIGFSIPAYIIYAKVMGNNTYLRKGLKEIRKPTVEDISKEDNTKSISK